MHIKELLVAGLLHGECITCTGKTLAENLEGVPSIRERRSLRQSTGACAASGLQVRREYGQGGVAAPGHELNRIDREMRPERSPNRQFGPPLGTGKR